MDVAGKVVGSRPASTAAWGRMLGAWMSVKSCEFRPYAPGGKATLYKGLVELRP